MRTQILITLDYFLPGFKAGGPARTIANLVEHLGDEVQFRIITRDRDLDEPVPYADIGADRWTKFGPAEVFYASPTELSFGNLSRRIRATPHDVIYLNSLFSPRMTQIPLFARRLGLLGGPQRWVLAPRGELGVGALGIKSAKKRMWLAAARRLGLLADVTWQASTELEKNDILTAFPTARTKVACDLATRFPPVQRMRDRGPGDPLRMVFLARVVPIKNLHFALETLARVAVPIIFDIFGPLEDAAYWNHCQTLIDALPGNVRATYRGAIEPSAVRDTLSSYDVFFLPSGGENFGHVMSEALQSGLPLLLSDQTPWQKLRQHGVGHSLPLDDPEPFVNAIQEYSRSSRERWREIATHVAQYVDQLQATTSGAVAESRRLFGLDSRVESST